MKVNWKKLPAKILDDPSLALELSEDPVRLYLREIGQIHLLDADSEFRLSTRNEGVKKIEELNAHFPVISENSSRLDETYADVSEKLIDSYKQLKEKILYENGTGHIHFVKEINTAKDKNKETKTKTAKD